MSNDNKQPDNENGPKTPKKNWRTWYLLVLAILIVMVLGFVPWEELTGGLMKNYNIFSDIMPEDTTAAEYMVQDVEIPLEQLGVADHGDAKGTIANDSLRTDTAERPLPAPKPNRRGDVVVFEDYTPGGNAMASLRARIANGRPARIAVVGDSYIEGDIFSQDFRALMQSAYGGSGVGYMNMHSDFPGFRRSVSQSGNKNWKCYTATKRGKEAYMSLSEQYATPTGEAIATYKGVKAISNADKWTNSRFLFISPQPATVYTRVNDQEWEKHEVAGSELVQCIDTQGETTEFSVKTSSTNLVALGVWLDNDYGVSVDCMSSRGIPGYSLSKISPELAHQMNKFIKYDMIVLEFGVNAMSAKQKNYSVFSSNMEKVVDNLRRCYPGAQILIMGVGDRGEKKGGEVHSMSTIQNMIDAQRQAAMRSGVLFWDTREAMGGSDAIVEWSRNKWANKDYIHLTHKGGAELAKAFFQAFQTSD